ncbi:MAG: cytochrome C [Cypionkella sp.]|nr:cytochrome C [Cypionkella sp.]
MTKLTLIAAFALTALTAPAFADPDAAKGESDFKKCKACHSIIADDGTAIQKGGKTGPNLYGVIGRVVGTEAEFADKYDEATKAVGAAGTVWTEEELAAYVVDPSKWLQEKTGDAAAKSKMTFKLAKGGDDIAAYLASLKPAE